MISRAVILPIFLSLAFRASAGQAVRTLEEVHDACERRQNNIDFDCSGTVIVPPLYPRAPFHVAYKGQSLCFYDLRTDMSAPVAEGDHVRMVGRTEPSGHEASAAAANSNPNCYAITVLSHGEVPKATPVSIRDFTRGFQPSRHLELTGTVRDVFPDDIDPHYAFVILQDGEDFAYLAYPGGADQLPGFRALRGSVVAASGVAWGSGNRHIGKSIMAFAGTNAFRVVKHADSLRFDVPTVNADSFRLPGDIASLGLRKTSGTVVATWHDDMFLLIDENGSPVKVELSEPSPPAVSECVEAVGYLETDLFHLSFVRASWRRLESARQTTFPVTSTTIKDIFVSPFGQYRIPVAEHGKTLRVRGTVKSILLDEHGRKRILVSDEDYAIPVDGTHIGQTLKSIKEGSFVEVTGVCIKDSDAWRPNFLIPHVRGLFLVPRSDADVKVLRSPPWWTPARFLWALGILLAAIAGILVWNATLHALVVRKSRALVKEQAEKISETLKISERTRLAAELHDFHSQNLTAISYQISSARNACADDPAEASRLLATAAQMLKSCRTELRRCLWDLRYDVLNFADFGKAILQTISPVASSAKVSVRFAGRRAQISDSTAHAVLCILRELTSNAANHGRAHNIRIAGECRLQALSFSVLDDGCGFDPGSRPGQDNGHFGLDGIAERLKRLGGTMEIDSSPGNGCYVRITIDHSKSQSQP